jgi:deazaflavin-dependent oxidoreductase (nitroreductase family)
MDASVPSAVNQPQRGGRAQTLALQGLVNRVIRGLLRTPVLCRAVGKRLITVYVVGRKSGRRYSIPVAYTRRGQTLLIGTEFAWVRNLRSGEPVDIRWKGKRCSADVKVLADEDAVVAHLDAMTRDNHQFAKFNRISFDSDGNPNAIDLHLAWEAGTRGVELTPRPRK